MNISYDIWLYLKKCTFTNTENLLLFWFVKYQIQITNISVNRWTFSNNYGKI